MTTSIDIFHIPIEENMKKRNTYKANTYAHYVKDLATHKSTISAFEVGVRGYLTIKNKKGGGSAINVKKEPYLKIFCEAYQTQSITGSSLIYTAWKQPTWGSPGIMT